jgi:hypothetical protein
VAQVPKDPGVHRQRCVAGRVIPHLRIPSKRSVSRARPPFTVLKTR